MAKYRAIPPGFMTVGEAAKKMGVTVRTLQYYDREGVLSPSAAKARAAQALRTKSWCIFIRYYR